MLSKKRIQLVVFAGVPAVILLGVIVLVYFLNAKKEGIVYKETTVQMGNLSVGVTADGSTEIGTVVQSFELDLSAFISESSDSSSSSQGSGMEGMGAISNMFSNSTADSTSTDSYTRELEIEEVFVTSGQQIKKGDALFQMTEESVSSIRGELETDKISSELVLDKLNAEQEKSVLSEKHSLESAQAYSEIAVSEQASTVFQLNVTLQMKKNELEDTNQEMTEMEQELSALKLQYDNAANVLKNAVWAVSAIDREAELYWYIKEEGARKKAESTKEELEAQMEELETKLKDGKNSIPVLSMEIKQAERELQMGTLEAENQYQTRLLAGSQSKETYQVAVGYLNSEKKDAEDEYEDAGTKWDEFNSYIKENTVFAEYDGVITEVGVKKGDKLASFKSLVTLNNQEDITMTVEVTDTDMELLDQSGELNVILDSYPDSLFRGSIEEIGDAVTNSSTGAITYEVTVLLSGDLTGILEGMTGDVTFITKESREVFYVSNRAIIRSGSESYVKLRDASGNVIEQEVTTGFSDGINVEIIEGLTEGDVVLIESGVDENS